MQFDFHSNGIYLFFLLIYIVSCIWVIKRSNHGLIKKVSFWLNFKPKYVL